MGVQYHNGGNSEVQQKQALAYLLPASPTVGIAASGVLDGLVVTQTASASGSVLISAGGAVNQASLGQGADLVYEPSQVTLDVFTANPMGGVKRNDVVAFDSVTSSIIVVTGTPNATPTDPTIAATRTPLARLRHLASATTIPAAQIDQLQALLPTGPVVSFAAGNTGLVANGTIVIPSVILPAFGVATRVYVQASGAAGFRDVAQTVAVRIIGSQTVTQSLEAYVYAVAGQWATVARSGYMDIPANTAATVSLMGTAGLSGGTAYYQTAMTLTRVTV